MTAPSESCCVVSQADGAARFVSIVQLPITCQSLRAPALSAAFIHSCRVPAYPLLKLSARFNVKFVPAPDADELPALTVHWLFCKLPFVPSCTGPCQTVPASLSRNRL